MAGGTVTRPADGQVAENMPCVGNNGTSAASGEKAGFHPAYPRQQKYSEIPSGDLEMRPSSLNCKEEQAMF